MLEVVERDPISMDDEADKNEFLFKLGSDNQEWCS